VLLNRASITAGLRGGLAATFPGPGSDGEPIALLSFASAGDMKFGDPSCARNRERFLRGAGLDPTLVLGLDLAHSRKVLFPARGEDPAKLARDSGGADGLVLVGESAEGLAASVTVADCMPIWLLDRASGAFGILHSGWRGTGILEAAVRAIAGRFGSRPSSIAVILGPAIGPCCYAVPEERAAEFGAEFGEASVSRREGSFYLDLRSANIALAERAGVGFLLSIETCTACDPRLGSFRRQGPAAFTRMLAVCCRPPRGASLPGLGRIP
jgi:polyphenol oxidase